MEVQGASWWSFYICHAQYLDPEKACMTYYLFLTHMSVDSFQLANYPDKYC